MKYSDLHIHSCYSDGVLTPEKIIKVALEKNLKTIAITDHDTLSSQYVTKLNLENLDIISGIEISSKYKENEIHILGYYINIEESNIKRAIDILKTSRENRFKEVICRLNNKGIYLSMDDFSEFKDSTIGRAHIANVLVKKGYSNNYKEAFNLYLLEGKDTFVERYKFSYRETIDIIRKSGGIAILSHPGKIKIGIDIENLIKDLKFYGLQGIEVYHPSHNSKQISYFYNLAKKHKLLITGGSDCHGMKNITDEILLGSYGIDEILMNKIKAYHLKQRR
ncbi:hypothetical protein SAMN02745163_03641 [Clostridium cavendishii DSM 21758]|uniref:Polymerase/histidinol phosphatase N-terminal domain-containing protein n=1 Tax=Clostridium cavendishii DSM 21758 TaxID=1121302 RepID=A0A1M6RQA3_9CLOT|nr:PHP domain-containing protein [Clostridium cavendishii]SHK34497.1 hypothetical protein SAMN02745163_03641 [Clostridium cavendishii DSM 21758]